MTKFFDIINRKILSLFSFFSGCRCYNWPSNRIIYQRERLIGSFTFSAMGSPFFIFRPATNWIIFNQMIYPYWFDFVANRFQTMWSTREKIYCGQTHNNSTTYWVPTDYCGAVPHARVHHTSSVKCRLLLLLLTLRLYFSLAPHSHTLAHSFPWCSAFSIKLSLTVMSHCFRCIRYDLMQ